MNTIRLSNTLFHSFDGGEPSFLKTLDAFRDNKLSVVAMQNLRKFSKKVGELNQLFIEGKNDIVNKYGSMKVNEAGEDQGMELRFDNAQGMKAYNELLQLTNEVTVDIIDLAEENRLAKEAGRSPIAMSDKEYDVLVFLFEDIKPPEGKKEKAKKSKKDAV